MCARQFPHAATWQYVTPASDTDQVEMHRACPYVAVADQERTS
jgi:hypothetical protein